MLRGALNEKFLSCKVNYSNCHGGGFFVMGGKPVDRTKSNNLVDAVVNELKKIRILSLHLFQKEQGAQLKNGKQAYYISKGSNIPIVPCGLDFKERTLL